MCIRCAIEFVQLIGEVHEVIQQVKRANEVERIPPEIAKYVDKAIEYLDIVYKELEVKSGEFAGAGKITALKSKGEQFLTVDMQVHLRLAAMYLEPVVSWSEQVLKLGDAGSPPHKFEPLTMH